MKCPENWALPYAQAEAYFRSQSDVEECGPGRFQFGTSEIQVTELPDEIIGPIVLPRTKVVFLGEGPDTQEIRRRFMVHYLSKNK